MSKVYAIITDRIVKMLENGVVPWRKPWKTKFVWPLRYGGKPYRGLNVFILASMGYSNPHWLSFKQINKLGGLVKPKEKSTMVIFWKIWKKTEVDVNGEDNEKHIPMLRYYKVFNAEQTTGLPEKYYPKNDDLKQIDHDPISAAEEIVANMPDCPPIEHGSERACYSPPRDLVRMPDAERFESSEAYYCTLFHELTHSTGHESRCNRNNGHLDSFGKEAYSKEELVAEMGAAFLCGEAGVLNPEVEEQSAAYIQGWLKELKKDPKLIVSAAAQAQKSTDFILDRKFDNAENNEDDSNGKSK